MFNPSKIEIDKVKYFNNIEQIKKWLKPETKISSVIKGNGYGHGIKEMTTLAMSAGLNHFSVYSADEAVKIKEVCGNDADIMVMGYADNRAIEWMIENNISFYIFNFERLFKAIETSLKLGKKAKVHIEVETGMNRTGFVPAEMKRLIGLLQENTDTIIFEGLCTHFAGAEQIANYVRVQKQKKVFLKVKRLFEKQNLKPNIYHTCCSAASIRLPEMQMDMVRVGILQYGLWPSPEIYIEYLNKNKKNSSPLKRILTWTSKVMSIKNVKMGEYIGYGNSYLASKDTKIAVIPIGYAHGFARSLSNVGRVLINKERVPIIGTVNMNCIVVNVTDLENVKIDDEAVLIGYQGDKEITISSFSESSDQVNYELLTRLPQDIPRKIIS